MARLNYFGAYWDSEDGRNAADAGDVLSSWLYPPYSGKALLDVELGIPVGNGATIAIGAENILNAYPDIKPLRRRQRGQPVRPVLAVRLQRGLLLHPHRLRVGPVAFRIEDSQRP